MNGHDELGAHVSAAGGVQNAPPRAREIESVCLQLFTKQPNRWNEPKIDDEARESFLAARKECEIRFAGAHDSYLINLSSPDPKLWERSYRSFLGELVRCQRLGLDFMVTHPGNATDGDHESGIARNGDGVARALEEAPESGGGTRILLELTAGTGTSVGFSFERLAAIAARVPEKDRARVAICFDTCHGFSAGYDLIEDYDGVWAAFDDVLGLDRLALFHMNDSRNPFGSRKDRHEHIGKGSLGEEPFRRIMTDERFMEVPKLLETPKEKDPVKNDLRNLGLLRSFRGGG